MVMESSSPKGENDTPSGVRFVVVVGSQRSGTTLTGQLLGAHSQAVLLDEDDGLYEWTSSVLGGHFVPRAGSECSFMQLCRRARGKYREPETRIDEMGQLRPSIGWCVLKAPNLTLDADVLAARLPGAVVVYVLRDLRDVVASMMALQPDRMLENQMRYIAQADAVPTASFDFLSRIRDMRLPPHVRLGLVARLKSSMSESFHGAGMSVMEMQYEDLVTRPPPNLYKLQRHCGMPPEPSCLHLAGVYQGDGPGRTNRQRAPHSESIGRWRRDLRDDQIADLEAIVAGWIRR
jgi:hypothetical protein